MAEGLRDVLSRMRAAASEFTADCWSGDDCARLAEELASVAKACTAAAARAAARAVACHAGDVEWMARSTGASTARAREVLATTTALDHCPATSEAVATGAISLDQAREIVAAEAAAPGTEADLLLVAGTSGMAGLREASRKVRLGAVERDERHRRQWAARSVQHWVDGDGMVAGRFRLPPEVGTPFVNRLDVETDRMQRAARKNGAEPLPREAHAADALVRMAKAARNAGSGRAGRAGRADVVFVCSLDAYRRGSVEGDELCHVIGAGPVPVSVVRDAVADDAFVKAVTTRGDEIHTVAHFGRRMSATLRTALELGPAPRFEGSVCIEEGCDRRYHLERDHLDPVANGGITSYENLGDRCRPHHVEKTERDRAAGRLGRGRPPPGSA